MGVNVTEYYQRITEVDIGRIGQELLFERITNEAGDRLMCNCPNHQSQSKQSLHIMLDKQGWYCFGCGQGGDVLQLVEFVQSGQITSGQHGAMPDSHRRARDFLADKAGLPLLSHYGLTKDGIAKTEAERFFGVRVKEALTELARFYHTRLKEQPKVLEWLKNKYAINDETIDDLLIGYADNSSGVKKHLTSGEHSFSGKELAATGAFTPTSHNSLFPFFDRRIIFPYWNRGRVVFMIGRKTKWTPVSKWEQGKYKKLRIFDEKKRSYIAPFINNSVLYNEDILLSNPTELIITEGVTDCIALMQQGFATISPVTTRIRVADWQRLIPKLRNIKTIYICQDNEISQAGLKGAMQTARVLAEHNIDTRVVTLPLEEEQIKARKTLGDEFGVTAELTPQESKDLQQSWSQKETEKVAKLQARAKIDLNDYFVNGHTPADYENLLVAARTPVEESIHKITGEADDDKREEQLELVLTEIAQQSPLKQDRLLRQVHERIKKAVVMSTLKAEVGAIKKNLQHKEKQKKKEKKKASNAKPGSCEEVVERTLLTTEFEDGGKD